MATKNHDVLRPLIVLRPFLFLGKHYKIGDIFDPVKNHCNRHKVELFVNRGYLDPYGKMPQEQPEKGEQDVDSQVPATDVEQPTEGDSQAESNAENVEREGDVANGEESQQVETEQPTEAVKTSRRRS